jgi:hypothetical protein
MFLIAGLQAGSYLLRYRRCLTPAGKIVASRAAILEPRAPIGPVSSSRAYVTGGHFTALGRVTVRPPAVGQAAAMPTPPSITGFTTARLRRHFDRQSFGGVSGTVLGPHGRHIKGLCFSVDYGGSSFFSPIGANGRYNTGKNLPPGKVAVGFSTACGPPFDTASANWAPEWYRGKFRLSAANTVVIKAGKITRGIGGVMRRGGVISGRVTGHTGRGLGGVCVVAVTPKGDFVQQVTTPRDGRYRFQGLDPGRYGLGFFPACGRISAYLPQWWPGRATETKAGLIRTGFGTTRDHIDAKMVLGGTISGVVKFRNRRGRPIKGICVDVTRPNQPFGLDYLGISNAKGEYGVSGLPAGRYSVNFSPGCNNNGNYLSQNYPHNVTARLAHVTGNINAYLQPGAIVRGTVTAKSTGARLAGICVMTADGFSGAETRANGTYSMDQIPPGKIGVQFFNCNNPGNYAPQSAAASIKVRPGQVVSGIDAALAPGATISGTISLASGRKLSNVCIDAIPASFSADGGSEQVHRGRYVIKDLAPGLYQVFYSSCGGANIADAWFMQPGKVTDDESRADQIYVPAGGLVAGIDAVLQLGGYISGRAFGPASQQGSDVCILINNARTGVSGFINGFFDVSVGDGYTIFGFAPGRYIVEFFPCSGQNLAVQWYKRASQPARATPVLVRAGHTTSNVDAWLATGGSITGRVVSKGTGKPLAGVCVGAATSVNQPISTFGRTNRAGKYVVTGLNSSNYRLYLTSCSKVRLVPMVTRKLRATQGKTVTAPQVAMHGYQAGAISGRVAIAGSPRNAAAGACIAAVSIDRGAVSSLEDGFATARRGGYYRIAPLVPGRYKIFFDDCSGDALPQWYRNASRKSDATVVSVAAGRTTRRISVTLQPRQRDGSISGTVTGPKPANKPLAGICVQVVPVGRGLTPYLAESTTPGGTYHIGPVPPGRYIVEFEARCAASGYKTQWWPGATSVAYATPVTVRPGLTRSGIDAHMTPLT